jgi:hypothetical protein
MGRIQACPLDVDIARQAVESVFAAWLIPALGLMGEVESREGCRTDLVVYLLTCY